MPAGARTHQLAIGSAVALTMPPTLVYTSPPGKTTIVKWLGCSSNNGLGSSWDVFLSVSPAGSPTSRSRVASVFQIFPGGQLTASGSLYAVLEPGDELWVGSTEAGSYDYLISGAELNT